VESGSPPRNISIQEQEMAVLIWDETYSVQIESIDEQHKILFSYINDLVEAMQEFRESDVVSRLLPALMDYTIVHFGAEEKLMEENGYPKLDEHKQEHEKFINMIKEFEEKFKTGDRTISLGILDFLVDWLKNHIMGTDMKYTPHLKEKGVR
jgi:hemerythrin-like metal-binding protein